MSPANEHIARVLADTNEVWPAEVVFQERKEASGEAEKHAVEIIGYVAPFEWKKHQSEVMCKVTRTPQLEHVHGLRAPVAAAPHFAIPPSTDVVTLQRELAIAYAGLEREREITKELAAALQSFIAEFGDKSTSATVRAGRAALRKVQK